MPATPKPAQIDSFLRRVIASPRLHQVALENHQNNSEAVREVIRRRGFVRTYVEFAVAWAILHGVRLLPRWMALKGGQAVGAIAHAVLPHLRRHAEDNLQLAFPDLPEAERQRIKRGTFRNLGRLLGEVSQFPKLNRHNIESVVSYVGLENYLKAEASGRGVILLTGHIGAWELSVFAHSIYGHPMSFLARRVDNPLVERLAESNRTRFGNRSIDKKNSVREVLKTLKSGGVVGILADLNASREEGVFCDFFGIPACTTAGVATLALRTGAVVLPGYIVWDEAAKIHRLHFEPPIETVSTGNRDEDVQTNTANYTRVIESIVRRHPDQWLWIHRRWRTRPESEPEIY
ncbi:MAG: lysophospholipid acyltransferase family protein [Acidobacteriota bacterium]|nr:lysophospholipid acyltransferase family protein [Acidobacteriota bacterium]